MLLQDGLPFHFTPSVPAQWEANFLDPESPEANVTAALAVAESSNLKDRHDLAHGVEDLGEFAKWVQGCLCKKRVSTHRWIATFDGLLMFYDVLFSLNVLKS